MASPANILRRADQWYSRRMARGYTRHMESEALQNLVTGRPDLHEHFFVNGAAVAFTRAHVIKDSQTFFQRSSHALSVLERFLEIDEEEVHKRGYDTYFAPVVDLSQKTRRFYEGLIQHGLTDEGITRAFCEGYENGEGFADYCIETSRAVLAIQSLTKPIVINPVDVFNELLEPIVRRQVLSAVGDIR